MTRLFLALSLLALATGCARPERVAAPAPLPVVVPPPVRAAAPRAPDGSAANLVLPARLADGSYATPNRGVTGAAAIWHLRAAFNVAALNCNDPQLPAVYNQVLTAHRGTLKAAHDALGGAYDARSAFDSAMTRLYNYFAQPPVMARFCAATKPLLHEAATLPAGDLAAFAPAALAAVDRPFTDFYARYDAWRADLAAWRDGGTPQLEYDPQVFAASVGVTGGGGRLAAR